MKQSKAVKPLKTMAEWPVRWDYKAVGNGFVASHACGPQHISQATEFNQPDAETFSEVMRETKLISYAPTILEALRYAVAQLNERSKLRAELAALLAEIQRATN